ncbi:hypothetical protein [Nocardia seriolae]|uniref:hypothetical protein n=1 Tax=Nocardia seriolae TaxID=37332 RepID=UPI00051A5A68|nr:hypothetical protein [Nocardia seriolae]MTJ63395.1 hypothetical protein [Nocardia seriolae]MTJ70204.1 hypothetical protein [Nocardia seriolae]MTJ88803.1 hypothetical protein [Nocardia seriolae]MTK32783.1 hypothetical protein [Nocardia seriolae]MTK41295.1 hypothetical protein [Nocardia seriolae]
MTIEHPREDEVSQLAQRVEKARGRLAYQYDPALTDALSETELVAERDLAERIREQERAQRWKQAEAAANAADRARQTTEEIEKADIRDLLLARKAIAAQRRESSPHAKLASLYKHRAWSQRALAGVVAAGMLWSAVNVQHNIAPGGASDPLYWFSYLLEGMISVCLVIIMIGTNKVAEWGVIDSRKQVVVAEIALLSLTVILNTYPYLKQGSWYDVAVHTIAPVMIGVALLIHNAAAGRYGLAIVRATDQIRDLPDPGEQLRRAAPTVVSWPSRPQPPSAPTPTPALPAAPVEAERTVEADARVVEPDTRATKSETHSDNGKSADKERRSATGKTRKAEEDERSPLADLTDPVPPLNVYDTGQFRIAETLEQELAELQAARRRARTASRPRNGSSLDD